MSTHVNKLGEAQQRDLIQEICNYFFDADTIDIEIIPHLRRVERIALYGAGAPLDRHDLEALSTLRTITDALEDATKGHSYFDAPEEDDGIGAVHELVRLRRFRVSGIEFDVLVRGPRTFWPVRPLCIVMGMDYAPEQEYLESIYQHRPTEVIYQDGLAGTQNLSFLSAQETLLWVESLPTRFGRDLKNHNMIVQLVFENSLGVIHDHESEPNTDA